MDDKTTSGDVTRLLKAMGDGDHGARDRLLPLVYRELRGLARYFMAGEGVGHTLQPTALVHEAYLRLIQQDQVNWQSRAHFFGIAAQAMRRILVDHAKRRKRLKRNGERLRVPLDDVQIPAPMLEDPDQLIALDDALTRLAKLDPRQSRIVELRYFSGLTVEETAEVLGKSAKTVKRDWQVARAWLHGELNGQARV